MNLSLTECAELPFACALIDTRGDVVVATPEWRGVGPGAASFPVRGKRLVVSTQPAMPRCAELLARLFTAFDDAAGSADASRAPLLRMLATSLRLVAGRDVSAGGAIAASSVLDLARRGIQARTTLDVGVEAGRDFNVRCGEAAALALVQLAVNAERHGGATAVTLSSGPSMLQVTWQGTARAGALPTARRSNERERWGLGFARIASDAIGGVIHTPRNRGSDTVTATLELDVGRLTLPLALVREQRVVRATRAWEEETGALPGAALSPAQHAAVLAAERAAGCITQSQGLAARVARDVVWLGVAPDDLAGRARDVIDGLTHERVLADGVEEPARSRISALAQLIAFSVGGAIQRVPARAWTSRMRELAGPFALPMPIPDYDGVGAADPAVCALLAAEAGERFEVEAEVLWLRLRQGGADDPVAVPLLTNGSGRLRLG